MAYDRREGQTVYRLAFPDRPGLTVRVRRASLAGLIDIAEATPVLRRNIQRGEDVTELENLRAWRKLARAFAGGLVDWDLVDGGVPVPATLAGVMSLELDEVMGLVGGWRQAMAERPEVDGAEFAEADDVGPDAGGDKDEDGPGVDALDEEWLAQLPVSVLPDPGPVADPVSLPDPAAEAVMADA